MCIHTHTHACAWSFSHIRLSATPWTIAAGLLCPWEFSRQEYWSSLPWPPPGDFPNPEIEPRSPTLQADSLPSQPPGKPIHTHTHTCIDWCTYPLVPTQSYVQRKKIIPKIQCPLKKSSGLTVDVFGNPIYASKCHLDKTYNVSVTGKVPLRAFPNSHSPETSYFLSSITADEFSLSSELKWVEKCSMFSYVSGFLYST